MNKLISVSILLDSYLQNLKYDRGRVKIEIVLIKKYAEVDIASA